MQAMRKYLSLLFLLIIVALSGCALAVYGGAAVSGDERNMDGMFADEVIEAKIREAFLKDNTAKLRNITVSCFNGCVYLVGQH